MITSEGLVSGSNPDEEIGTSNSNVVSERSDFDSFGHETAKCMMTFLLPQAIPLLNKTSRKTKAAVSPLEVPLCGVNSQKEYKENHPSPPGVVSLNLASYLFFLNVYPKYLHKHIQFNIKIFSLVVTGLKNLSNLQP